MKRKRNHSPLWHRLLCLLMAFYVINVSIDAPDGYVTPNSQGEYKEDLSFNEIESFSELVLEEGLDLYDAVPEHDESDEEDDQLTKILVDWAIPGPLAVYRFESVMGYLPTPPLPFTGIIYQSKVADINSPPPKQA